MDKLAASGPIGYVHLTSLGCPKNLVDTEVMAGSLCRAGLGLTSIAAEADLCLVNTCAFVSAARTEAARELKQALAWKRRRRGRQVVVCGCLPQWDQTGDFRRDYPEVDAWLGVDQAPRMGEILRKMLSGASRPIPAPPTTPPRQLCDHRTPRLQLTPRHYAYLKIADGCNNRCAYCTIPRLRGGLRSRRLSSVVAEAGSLLASGVRELILIAQDTAAFGDDHPERKEDLPRLLQELEKLPGRFWVRLLYAHPASLLRDQRRFEQLLACFSSSRRLLPYLDLPLQHITDRMLQRMGRKTSRAEIEYLLDRLENEIPELTLRTTFMVGHPGETEADYAALRDLVASGRFARMGVFTYSPEAGTDSARQSDPVPPAVAEARAHELAAVQARIMRRRHRQLVGTEMKCIVDTIARSGAGMGRTAGEAPEIDPVIRLEQADSKDLGRFCRVEITGATSFVLRARIIRTR